ALLKLYEPASNIVVVDGLYECNYDNGIRIIVQLLAKALSLESMRFQALLTNRLEVPICHGFLQIANAEYGDFELHNISPSVFNHDFSMFLEHRFCIVAQEYYQAVHWTGVDNIRQSCQSAGRLFIWTTATYRFIQQGRWFAGESL
ncbi:hypothetical protein DPSP01_014476, partial [Paraphaeosphaeria sporulosa]